MPERDSLLLNSVFTENLDLCCSPEIRLVKELDDRLVISVSLEHDDLVLTFAEKRSGDIERLLRSAVVVVASDVEPIDDDESAMEPVEADECVGGRVRDAQISAQERRFSITRGVGCVSES